MALYTHVFCEVLDKPGWKFSGPMGPSTDTSDFNRRLLVPQALFRTDDKDVAGMLLGYPPLPVVAPTRKLPSDLSPQLAAHFKGFIEPDQFWDASWFTACEALTFNWQDDLAKEFYDEFLSKLPALGHPDQVRLIVVAQTD